MKFNCGCSYDNLDLDNIPMDCPATWGLIGEGFTKGIFQLEKSLGKRWSKRIKPRNIEELSDVISLIRPGPLMAEYREDPKNPGKMLSIADTYVAVRNGEIEPEYIDDSFEDIFKSTYSVPVYQEQVMRICTDFAGFSLLEADDTRKAVGKKDDDIMQRVGEKFIHHSVKNGKTKEMAETVFSWIDKFSGYSFNKSHGVGYALIGYQTAYCKVHFPLYFFKHMLSNSDSKQDSADEVNELVMEAKVSSIWNENAISIMPPSLKNKNSNFQIEGDNKILFGLSHIKGVGTSAIKKLNKIPRDIADWNSFLREVTSSKLANKGVMESLIKSGALDYLEDGSFTSRLNMLKTFLLFCALTPREKDAFLSYDGSLNSRVRSLVTSKIPRKDRKNKILAAHEEVERTLGGHPKRMSLAYEKHLLGIPLSGSEVELYSNERVNTTCRDFLRLRNGDKCNIGVIINDIRTIKDKNSNMMCFLKVSDSTYMLDGVVVFSRQYNNLAWILEIGRAVLIKGRKDNDSLIVHSIEHL